MTTFASERNVIPMMNSSYPGCFRRFLRMVSSTSRMVAAAVGGDGHDEAAPRHVVG